CPPAAGRQRRHAGRRGIRPPAVPGPGQHRRRHRQRIAGARGALAPGYRAARGAGRAGQGAAAHRERAVRQWREAGRSRLRSRRTGRSAGRGAGQGPRLPAPVGHRAGGPGDGRGRRRRSCPGPARPARRRGACRGRLTTAACRTASPTDNLRPVPLSGSPRMTPSRIPTLDIRRFEGDRDAFVAELGAAYREWGFAGIRGHGIPAGQIDTAYDVFQRFFALPDEVKRKYHVPGGGGARGYTPFGVETAKGATHFDLKEFWHVGREIPRDSRYADVMPPNLWPEEIPEFREVAYG